MRLTRRGRRLVSAFWIVVDTLCATALTFAIGIALLAIYHAA